MNISVLSQGGNNMKSQKKSRTMINC